MDKKLLTHITAWANDIAQAVEEAPDAVVPGCPGWRLRDLGGHVVAVARLWTDVVAADGSIDGPIVSVEAADRDMPGLVRTATADLLDTLGNASPDTRAWSWWGDTTARAIPRRVLHEMAVHRCDAQRALGRPPQMDPAIAADGVEEFFEVIVHLNPSSPPDVAGTVTFDLTDVGRRVRVTTTPPDVPALSTSDEDADATVEGAALDVLLVLWRRLDPAEVQVTGDVALVERLVAYPYLGRSGTDEATS